MNEPWNEPFCGKCMTNHARGAACEADLEAAVIEAAIKWRYQAHSENAVDDALWEAVDTLLKAREITATTPLDKLTE